MKRPSGENTGRASSAGVAATGSSRGLLDSASLTTPMSHPRFGWVSISKRDRPTGDQDVPKLNPKSPGGGERSDWTFFDDPTLAPDSVM